MAVRNRDDDDDNDDDRPRKKKPRPSEEIQDQDRPLKKRRPADDEDEDDDDDRPRRRSVRRSSPDDGGVGVVIPYRNGMALLSYYLGIFGLIPCVIGMGILGIVPLVLGILGLKKARLDPDAHGSAHAWIGIVLGAVEILTGCGVIGFFVFAALSARR
jgi:hypothetical protein